MKRPISILLLFILFLHTGCSKDDPESRRKKITLPANTTYHSIYAWTASQFTKVNNTPTPVPEPPKVKVGDKCHKCNGTGKLKTDGVQIVACFHCKGDGKVDKGDPILGVSTPPTQETDQTPPEKKAVPDTTQVKTKEIIITVEIPHYTINVNGRELHWEGDTHTFSALMFPNETLRMNDSTFDPAVQNYVEVCKGNYCMRYPITRSTKIEKVRSRVNDENRPTERAKD